MIIDRMIDRMLRMDNLLICSPVLTCQWIAESARSMDALRIWAINQLDLVMDMGVGLGQPVLVGRFCHSEH